MGKAPAFQFYASDFLTSTSTLSLAAKGAFISYLSWSWVNGPLPESDQERARVIGISPTKERKIWAEISRFWTMESSGWINRRLEDTRQKQAENRAIQAEKGRRGGEATAQRRLAGATAPAAVLLQPERGPSSSSSSSEDQVPVQELRVPRPARFESTPNSAALTKIAVSLRAEYPADPDSEWNQKIRDAAARARIHYDPPAVALAMTKAKHSLEKMGSNP